MDTDLQSPPVEDIAQVGGGLHEQPTEPGDSHVGRRPSSHADSEGEPERIGRFAVLHKIGEGGMGIVYAALDDRLDRKVAIKLLHSTSKQTDVNHARIIREARAMAQLSHPNVVQVYEVEEVNGKIFVTMEYVEGETLGAWIKAAHRPTREILEVFYQAGQGLAAAHDVGIIHRDFKPDNVIVGRDGRVKVLDFGLARRGANELSGSEVKDETGRKTPQGREVPTLTKTGTILGTPFYMSPEQFMDRRVDASSDQFSFCVALYEALFSERPFAGDTLDDLIINVVAGRLRGPRLTTDIPRHLPNLLRRGLAIDPADRFPSMHALLTGLQDFQSRVDSLNTKMLRLETGLGSTLFLLFWILDWLFIENLVWTTLGMRLGICTCTTFIYLICRFWPRQAERHVDVLAFSINLIAGWGLVGIIWLEGGLESHYYAGLILLVLCLGIMFLWPLKRALVLNGLIYLFYMSPLVFDFLPIGNPRIIIANQFFLISTIVLTIAAQRQRYVLQHRQFLAEQELNTLVRGGGRIAGSRRHDSLGGHPS